MSEAFACEEQRRMFDGNMFASVPCAGGSSIFTVSEELPGPWTFLTLHGRANQVVHHIFVGQLLFGAGTHVVANHICGVQATNVLRSILFELVCKLGWSCITPLSSIRTEIVYIARRIADLNGYGFELDAMFKFGYQDT